MSVNDVIAYAIYLQAVTATAFVFEYQRYTKGGWRRHVVGWHLMAITSADALFAIELAIAHFWPKLVPLEAFRVSIAAVFAFTALVVASRLVILEISQRKNLDPDRETRREHRRHGDS